jgi:CRP-like cAMP-binding protein
MYLQQADLTRGVGRDFVRQLTEASVRASHAQGEILFRRGDPAFSAYLLLSGRVNLKLGETGHVIHIVSRAGETFGWSSLVGHEVYSATAECAMETNLRVLHRDAFRRIVEKDPANALIFYQRLASMLGNRLLASYARFEKLFEKETFV